MSDVRTVGDLIDKLEDYGRHIPVVVKNDDDPEYSPINIIRQVEAGPNEEGEASCVIWAS